MEEIKINLNTNIQDLIAAQVNKILTKRADTLIGQPLSKMIKDELNKIKPTKIVVPDVGVTAIIKERLHKCFKSTLLISRVSKQCMLVGPAGTGKTTLASQVAQALKLPFAAISCSAGMSEAHLTGRMLFDGRYVQSEFVDIYENGGVFLFDEIDAADPNTLLVINSALANGYMNLVNRPDKPKAIRHKDTIIIVSGNTFGLGSNQYHGRNYLDAAFLDRFAVTKITVDYDEDLERELCSENGEQFELMATFHTIRQNVKRYELNRVVSTRVIVEAVRQLKADMSKKEILERFVAGWTKDERNKGLKPNESQL